MSLLDSVKNKAASLALRAFLNQHVSRYAELHEAKVDLAARTVTLDFQLNGDPQGFSVTLRYDLVRFDLAKHGMLKITETTLTPPRTWMNLLIQDHLVGKEFDIPPAVAKFL